MKFSELFKKKKAKTVDFTLTEEKECFTLENQNGKIEVKSETDIHNMFADFLADIDQFIILDAPKSINNIRFIQASHVQWMIEVRLGIENGGKVNLYFKRCGEGESRRIFADFYNRKFEPNRNEYKPVEFL